MQNRINIKIAGANYTVITEESEAHVDRITRVVDHKIREILESNERASVTMAAVMAAFEICDESIKAIDASDNLRAQIKNYLSEIAHSRSECDEARREISKLYNEISLLKQKIAEGKV